ncbi:MAG: histidinol-phosphate transaminase [Proteobacteria bacterium]|nr:histidinol-phosphate transaminase [Pseudomonadota bacterium]
MIPTPKPGILDIHAYVGGRAPAGGTNEPTFKLSSNESALGPSPRAVEAFEATKRDLSLYPEGGANILREAIGKTHGIDPERIVCGNGSGELLTLLANCYLRPGDEALYGRHAFLVYRIATLASSAIPIEVPEKNLRVDVDDMLAAVTPRTRLVYLANPNNPTGTYLTADEVRKLHAGLPPTTLLVIDAAYSEYVRRNDYESGLQMVSQFDNVVMTRTFSKIYALAALRVGWAYCPAPVADVLNRVRGPFNVSNPAQRAAVAALGDHAHVEEAFAHNEKWRAWLVDHIARTGLRVDNGVGNFVLIHFPREKGRSAKDADAFLMSKGLALRGVVNYGLPDCLRMTIGTEEANRRVVAALEEFVKRS